MNMINETQLRNTLRIIFESFSNSLNSIKKERFIFFNSAIKNNIMKNFVWNLKFSQLLYFSKIVYNSKIYIKVIKYFDWNYVIEIQNM